MQENKKSGVYGIAIYKCFKHEESKIQTSNKEKNVQILDVLQEVMSLLSLLVVFRYDKGLQNYDNEKVKIIYNIYIYEVDDFLLGSRLIEFMLHFKRILRLSLYHNSS